MANSLKTLNTLLAKLKLPKAQDLIGRKYCFCANKNRQIGLDVEVGTISRILYDSESQQIHIIPLSFSHASFDVLRFSIEANPEDAKSFGYIEREFRTVDDLADDVNCVNSVPGRFKILK